MFRLVLQMWDEPELARSQKRFPLTEQQNQENKDGFSQEEELLLSADSAHRWLQVSRLSWTCPNNPGPWGTPPCTSSMLPRSCSPPHHQTLQKSDHESSQALLD